MEPNDARDAVLGMMTKLFLGGGIPLCIYFGVGDNLLRMLPVYNSSLPPLIPTSYRHVGLRSFKSIPVHW